MFSSRRDLLVPTVTILAVFAVVGFMGQGAGTKSGSGGKPEIRLAYFPNVTHAPAIIGVGKGMWADRLSDYHLTSKMVNAGPEAMEALMANELDFSFVGPSPAINAYLKSKGKALRVISGACLGGASLIRRGDVQINSIKDLDGKRVAVPQAGGTQDVSCRHFLAANGLKAKDQGGTVEIVAVKNPDILALFKQKHLDAAWVPEPWAARIKKDAGAKTVVDERDLWPDRKFCTTLLVVRKAFADSHPDVVDLVLTAHLATLDWMRDHADEARRVLNAELKRLSGKRLPNSVLNEAWGKVTFTADPDPGSIDAFAQDAYEAGYLKEAHPNLTGMMDSRTLKHGARTARR